MSMVQNPKSAAAEDDLDINADAAIIVEASTGKILYGKNIDTALGIASMSKMMTEYLLFEAIHEGKISWDQEQTISDYAYDISQDMSLSNAPLNKGGTFTIRELYEAMAIYSANGATIAIAEAIAGSETEFVKMMNAKAEELGLDNYKFVNSTGLNNEDLKSMHPEGTGADEENVMSARSTAKLASKLLEDFPEVLETTSTIEKEFKTMAEPMKNWNFMLPGLIYGYEGMDGLKTGTTRFAGYCFTGTAERNNTRFITVIMNAVDSNGVGSYEARFGQTKKMLDYAFNHYSIKEIFPGNLEIEGNETLPVAKGKEKSVNIRTEEPLKLVVKNGEEELYKPSFSLDSSKLNEDGMLIAPVEKGEQVGILRAEYEGEVDFGYLDEDLEQTVKVITVDEAEKANWFVLMMRGIGSFFSDLWTSIADSVKGWF